MSRMENDRAEVGFILGCIAIIFILGFICGLAACWYLWAPHHHGLEDAQDSLNITTPYALYADYNSSRFIGYQTNNGSAGGLLIERYDFTYNDTAGASHNASVVYNGAWYGPRVLIDGEIKY